jgi:hypothetical protein
MKKLFVALLFIVPAFILVQGVGLGSAQSSTQTTTLQTNQIQYPVSWLGNCDSEADCQDYCTNAFNNQMCYEAELSFGVEFLTDFARDAVESVIDGTMYPVEFLNYCDSLEDCQNYCSTAAVYSVCYEAELQYGLEFLTQYSRDIVVSVMNGTIYPIPELGSCDSYNDCYTYCQDSVNLGACYDMEMIYGMYLLTQEQRDAFTQSSASASTTEESITVEQPPSSTNEIIDVGELPDNIIDIQESPDSATEVEAEQEQTEVTAMSTIEYPIEELGFCDSAEHCRVYCDDLANYDACLAYGVANRMYPPARTQIAEAVLEGRGPDNCSGPACVQECDSTLSRIECVEFAADNGALNERELSAAQSIIEESGPGGCVTTQECEDYCAVAANEQECFDYAVEHGLMDKSEVARVQALRSDGPGGCRGEIECEAYCAIERNIDECMLFATEHGLMTMEQEMYVADLHLETLDGPGGCRGEIECEAYCAVIRNEQECLQFAIDHRLEAAVDALNPDRVQTLDTQSRTTQTTDTSASDTQSKTTQQIDFIIEVDPETGAEVRVYLRDLINPSAVEFIHPEGCDTVDECQDFCDLPENKDACKPFSG